MSSVQGEASCKRCGGEESLIYDYNCRSGEETGMCIKCGYSYRHIMKKDSQGRICHRIRKIPIEEVSIAVNELVQRENFKFDTVFKERIPVTPDMTDKSIWKTINSKKGCSCSIEHNGKQIWYIGDSIKKKPSWKHLIFKETIWIDDEHNPKTIVNYRNEGGFGQISTFDKALTLEELLKDLPEDWGIRYAAVWNDESKKLEELFFIDKKGE